MVPNTHKVRASPPVWHSGNPPKVGVYRASRAGRIGRLRFWSGKNWSYAWGIYEKDEKRILGYRKLVMSDDVTAYWLPN